jgi:hypothetical protein
MAEKTEPEKTEPEGTEDTEAKFWGEFEKRGEAMLDKWFDKKAGDLKKARNGGRTTLPGILADLMFGPDKK